MVMVIATLTGGRAKADHAALLARDLVILEGQPALFRIYYH